MIFGGIGLFSFFLKPPKTAFREGGRIISEQSSIGARN